MTSEARPLTVDVLGESIPVKYVPFAILQCWGQASYLPGKVLIEIASEAAGKRLETTIFHERLEMALYMIGFDGDERTKEQVICVAERLL